MEEFTKLMEWAGNDAMATYEYTGGNKPSGDDARLPENLFDNNSNTIWHGTHGVYDATLTVTFVTPVRFQYLDWTIRNDMHPEQPRYRGACLHAGEDDVTIACFSSEITYTAGETYRITGDVVASKYKFKLPREGAGAELKVGYKLKGFI